MAQQINWQIPSTAGSGNVDIRKLNNAVKTYYTQEQCRNVVYALHGMHTSFDSIMQMRETIENFNGSSQLSFRFALTLDKYLNDNGIDINNVIRESICNLLFDNPGSINGSEGLIGWYFIEQERPVLCQIISPWDQVRDIAIRNLGGEQGEHYAKYQLKQWVDKYKKSWQAAVEYEEAYNQAEQKLKEEGGGKKLKVADIKSKVFQSSDITKATNYPFIPEACGEFFGVGDSGDDLTPQETAANIANVLWDNNYLLDNEATIIELVQKVLHIMNKSAEKDEDSFSGANSSIPATMATWLGAGELTTDANNWMCKNPDNCFDESIPPGCIVEDEGERQRLMAMKETLEKERDKAIANSNTVLVATTESKIEEVERELYWDPSTEPLKIQVLTSEVSGIFGFSMLGKELMLPPKDFSKFFLIPALSDATKNRIILGERIRKIDVFFGLNIRGLGYSLNFDDVNKWRRYAQGAIRDDYEKYGANPIEQLKVKTARNVAGGVVENNDFGNPHRNPTPAIKNGKPSGGLVCAICCRKPKQKSVNDSWPAVLNPSKFAGIAPKGRGKVEKKLAQEYDVDHIANLIFNALLDLNYSGLGFLNTCAGCNRHLKGEKLWSPSYELWQALLNRAGLDVRIYPWPGRNSPGLWVAQKQKTLAAWSSGTLAEAVGMKPFNGNRIYTIKAFYDSKIENQAIKHLTKKKKDTAAMAAKKEARMKEYSKGQGYNAFYSSSPKAPMAIDPPDMELIILDRYITTIETKMRTPGSVIGNVVIAERRTPNGSSGTKQFSDAYLELINAFPNVAIYEAQLHDVNRAMVEAGKTGKIAAQTYLEYKGKNLSPAKEKGSAFRSTAAAFNSGAALPFAFSPSGTGPGIVKRTASQNLTTVSDIGSPNSSQSSDDEGGIERSDSVKKQMKVFRQFPLSNTTLGQLSGAFYPEAARKNIGRRIDSENYGRQSHGVVGGELDAQMGINVANPTVAAKQSLLDPPPQNMLSRPDFTTILDRDSGEWDKALQEKIKIDMNLPDIWMSMSNELMESMEEDGELDFGGADETEAESAEFLDKIRNIVRELEVHMSYSDLIELILMWRDVLQTALRMDSLLAERLVYAYAALKRIATAEKTMTVKSPGRDATREKSSQALEKVEALQEKIKSEKNRSKRALCAMVLLNKIKDRRKKKLRENSKAKKLKMKRKRDERLKGEMKAAAEAMLLALAGRERSSSRAEVDVKRRRTFIRNSLGNIPEEQGEGSEPGDNDNDDMDLVGDDNSESSSLGSGSNSGSDDSRCEIPALTQDENAEFIGLINKDSTREDGSPYSGAAKREFEDQARRELRHTPSSYKPHFPLLNNMALEIFKLRMDWANGEINYIDTALYQGFLATGQGQEVARAQARNGADSAEATTNFLLTEDMVPQWITVQGQRERERIHWWSGELILAALKKYCPSGGWDSQLYDRDGINTRIPPTIIQSDLGDGNIQLRLIGGHWQFLTRVSESAPRWYRIRGERIGGDCGPSAVVMAINKYNEQRAVPMNMDTGQGGGKRKTRKKYKRKYRKKTRRK